MSPVLYAPAKVDQNDYFKGTKACLRETVPRWMCRDTNIAIGATGVLWSFPVLLYAGDVISNICTRNSGGTTTPTNYWFALYNPAGALMSQTADQTSTAWGSGTTKDLALQATQTITATGVHRVAIMVKSSGQPTFFGQSGAAPNIFQGLVSGQIKGAQTHDTGLTTTAPSTLGAATDVDGFIYFILYS